MSSTLYSPEPVQLAQLGPTNTGKTHRAVRRMLGHRTGMIGLPLRLLAREVYDRIVAEVGLDAVALVTGEERCVPEKPRYWVCTVESMPLSRSVEFVAIDEIQLATHPERGHAFTDRLMHASGTHETWFMGSDTMTPIVQQLAPTAGIETRARFSQLRYSGSCRLSALPPRSAVVAFSMRQVYEMAEQIRAHRGGTAVVMGALSPRARNAQVEMYQSGEVDFMVATDAIGMGLNMDIEHVAFSGIHKFDGQQVRSLSPAEMAQIAGRAGRYKRDGTFGTLSGVEPLPPRVIESIEQHRFEPVRRVRWRNSKLDYETPDTLVASLRQSPPHRCLLAQSTAVDEATLLRLLEQPEVRRRARDEAATRLLWEVCQVPDFRKTMVDSHVKLLTDIYLQLTGNAGQLATDWLAPRLQRLDRSDGGIETLTTRIAYVRTWTYIAHRSRWVDDPQHWYGLARDIEDRLSDALHGVLTHRFVDHKTVALVRGVASWKDGQSTSQSVDEMGQVEMSGQALGSLKGLDFRAVQAANPQQRKAIWKAARVVLSEEVDERIDRLVASPDEFLVIDPSGVLSWDEQQLGRLVTGADIFHPEVRLGDLALIDSHGRSRLHRRLVQWVRDTVEDFYPEVEPKSLSPSARGLLYALKQGLGCVPVATVRNQLKSMSKGERKQLSKRGYRFGIHYVYADFLLSAQALSWRSALWKAHSGYAHELVLPGQLSVTCPGRTLISWIRAIGYIPVGPLAIRVDQYETVRAQLRRLARSGSFQVSEALRQNLQCDGHQLTQVMERMGYRALEDGQFASRNPHRNQRRKGRVRKRQPQW